MSSASSLSLRLGMGGGGLVIVSPPSGEKSESRSWLIHLDVSSSVSVRSSLLLWLGERERVRGGGRKEEEWEIQSQLVHQVWRFVDLLI